MYGRLPTEIPDTKLRPMHLPDQVQAYAWLRAPFELKREIFLIGRKLGCQATAMAYNLHYEMQGLGCVSAAIPVKSRGTYTAYRQLEWDVGFSPAFRFQPVNMVGSFIRYTPGYVGALSGKTDNWHISMNAAPSCAGFEINYKSLPASWVLRRALAMNLSYEDTVDWLLYRTAVRRAYVVITSPQAARWLVLDNEASYIEAEVRYPEPLIVGNSEDQLDTPGEYTARLTDKPYQAEPGAWVLDRYAVKF